MTKLVDHLKAELNKIPNVSIAPYKQTDLTCVSYLGKEFAHFHDDHEIDVRIPQKFAKRKQLGEPIQSARHPDRSKKSIWRSLRFETPAETDALIELIQALLEEEYRT
ncbi:MAG: luciferase family protein [Chloroflexota bacterium]